MTDSFTYDGTGKLGDAIAKLYGFSPKNNNRIAELIASAKIELGIVSKSKKLPGNVKLNIYRCHYDRLHSVKINSQANDSRSIEIISQDAINDNVKINSQETTETVETFSSYRIAFHTTTTAGRKRQVIALDGFYLNALMLATGIDKKGIPAWIQRAVDNWTDFDAGQPITKQVKYLLIRELMAELERLKHGK